MLILLSCLLVYCLNKLFFQQNSSWIHFKDTTDAHWFWKRTKQPNSDCITKLLLSRSHFDQVISLVKFGQSQKVCFTWNSILEKSFNDNTLILCLSFLKNEEIVLTLKPTVSYMYLPSKKATGEQGKNWCCFIGSRMNQWDNVQLIACILTVLTECSSAHKFKTAFSR